MIAKRTSLGGGGPYETSFALGVAAGPSSTASRNEPLSRSQSHEFQQVSGILFPLYRMYYDRDFPRLFL